ncbi:hypothetical protein Q668_17375 [Alcanivorax sp. PN-3]|nr:hypothetical protein Q668_17375 [Alcanivorax sp. PN-3]
MRKFQLPLILDELGDFDFFGSAEDLELYVEAVDIESGEVRAYDGRGMELEFCIYGKQGDPIWAKKARLIGYKKDESEYVKKILKKYLSEVSEGGYDVEGVGIKGILDKALRIKGYSK